MTFSNIRYGGELAALTASLCWTATSFLFAHAGRSVGALAINLFRLPLAALCLGGILLATEGTVTPDTLGTWQLWLLIISAFFGLAFGDGFYFRSLVLIGPRRATLMSASSPVMTALLAIPLLGERLSIFTWGAILLTVCGMAWVIIERTETTPTDGHLKAGVIYGLIGAFGQGAGLLLAKMAMEGKLAAISTAFIRISSAAIMVWLFGLAIGKTHRMIPVLREKGVLSALIAASLLGPVMGVSMALFAYRSTEAGVAATLTALSPIFVIPVAWLRAEETPTLRTVAGTILAIVGVAIIFMR